MLWIWGIFFVFEIFLIEHEKMPEAVIASGI